MSDYGPRNTDSFDSGKWFRRAVVVVLVWMGIAVAGYYVVNRVFRGGPDEEVAQEDGDAEPDAHGAGNDDPQVPPDRPVAAAARPPADPTAPPVEIGIAYGTEKKRWLAAAAREFAKTPDGKRIKVNLIGMGSVESANAILAGDERIHVWSPASAMYRGVFADKWQMQHSGDPIAKERLLALTPMVFVFWQQRYEAFAGKFPEVTFDALSQALKPEESWSTIAQKPDWGVFKFSHTYPNQSNSGLMTLILMAYGFRDKTSDLTTEDVVDPDFLSWMGQFERSLSSMHHSTGTMMEQMVLRGPSTYDAIMVYESVAIDYLKNAEGRWGELRIVYPDRNTWNDNPYYILQTEWTTPEHQKAAEVFLEFLMSEPIQKMSLEHGFRPGNPSVPVKFPESPFVKYANYGLQIDLNKICDHPSPQVINNLQLAWQRAAGAR